MDKYKYTVLFILFILINNQYFFAQKIKIPAKNQKEENQQYLKIQNPPIETNKSKTTTIYIPRKISKEAIDDSANKELINQDSKATKEIIINERVPSNEPLIPPFLEIVSNSLVFTDVNGNQMIDANEQTNIKFQLKNKGKGPGLNLVASVEEKNRVRGIAFNQTQNIGRLQPNNTINIEIPISSDISTPNDKALFSITISEANGFGIDPVMIEIPTRSFVAPLLRIVDYKISSESGNTIQKNRPFIVQILMQNIGQGNAEEINLMLPLHENMFCLTSNTSTSIPQLAPGEQKLIEYQLIANNNYNESSINLEFQIKEHYNKYAENKNIVLAMNQQVASEKLVIKSILQEEAKIKIGTLSSIVDKEIPINPKKNTSRIALIIGNENYSRTLNAETNVPFARNDAQIFRQYALNTLGIEELNMRFVTDATAGEMIRNIDLVANLLERLGPSGELIFYYAGHGLPEEKSKEPYLIPVDVDATNLSAAIKVSDLYKKFTDSGARQITVFLDACFSGGGRNQGLLVSRGVKIAPREESIIGNAVVFSASSGEQTALSYDKEQHGMFTYFLLKRLQDTEGNITYGELADFIIHNVSIESLRVNNKEQDPEVKASANVQDVWRDWKFR